MNAGGTDNPDVMVLESIPVSPQAVNRSYVEGFLRDHRRYSSYFDPKNATTHDHASALRSVQTLYGTAMEDGGLSTDDRTHLAGLMTNTNAAAVDAYFQERYSVDPEFYNPRNPSGNDFAGAAVASQRDARAETETETEARPDGTRPGETDPDFGAGDRTIRRAADGGIIYDGAPSFEDVRAGDAALGLGHKSEEVRQVQEQLFNGGFYEGLYPEGTAAGDVADHFYGERTTEAVRRWQEKNGVEQTGQLDGRQLDALLNNQPLGSVSGDGIDQVAEDRHSSPIGLDINAFEASGDVWAGVTDNYTIRDERGRAVADDATHVGAGAEGQLTLAEIEGNLGDSKDLGVDGRAAVDANAYVGAEVAGKWEDGEAAIAGRGGAYAGVDAETSWGVGLRYFGVGQRNSVGLGAGAEAQGHATYEDGRLSMGYFAKGGMGVTAGHGNDVWVDFGQMKEDWNAFTGWVGGLFSGVDSRRE